MCRASFAAVVVLPEPWRPDERDDGRVALQPERPVAGREELDELVVDDLDDLLARR